MPHTQRVQQRCAVHLRCTAQHRRREMEHFTRARAARDARAVRMHAERRQDATKTQRKWTNQVPLTAHAPTSSCEYGTLYQKHTNFFLTITDLKLCAPCLGEACQAVRERGSHRALGRAASAWRSVGGD